MTTEETKKDVIQFHNVQDAIEHVEKLEKKARDAMVEYRSAIEQFTGITIGQQIMPMQLVKLILKFKDAE